MRFQTKFNEDFLYLGFVSFIIFVIFMVSGAGFLGSLISAILIYAFLRFTYWLFSLIRKIFGFWRKGDLS